jgi:hypothetical protein
MPSLLLGQTDLDFHFGAWEVERPPQRISTYYNGQDVPFEGRTLWVGEDSIAFFFSRMKPAPPAVRPMNCTDPDYRLETRSEEQFYKYELLPLDKLLTQPPDSIPVLSVFCPSNGLGAELYLLEKNHIVLAYLGLYCFLRPKRKWYKPWEWFQH